MPIRPAAWILAIIFFLLLVVDVIFGINAATGGAGEALIIWGPVIAVGVSWVIAIVGGIFSIYVLRIVKLLTLLYVIAAIVAVVASIPNQRWDILTAAIVVGVVAVLVGGFFVMFDQSVVRSSVERKLGGMDV